MPKGTYRVFRLKSSADGKEWHTEYAFECGNEPQAGWQDFTAASVLFLAERLIEHHRSTHSADHKLDMTDYLQILFAAPCDAATGMLQLWHFIDLDDVERHEFLDTLKTRHGNEAKWHKT
ncbi:MAG: hypothetical protein HY556_07165 [Euryarchaeota archaeon]|nr:hypothetical protein [Euryarchaeota archaeon]